VKVLFVERDVEYIDPMNIQLLSALAKQRGHSTFLTILSADTSTPTCGGSSRTWSPSAPRPGSTRPTSAPTSG